MLYRRVMVFAAHPDDEIAMGGTMARMAAQGTHVVVVQMTDGCEGYPELAWQDRIADMRRREADACNRVLGVWRRYHVGAPDMGLVNDKPTLQKVIRIIRTERPDAAFLQGDHTMHRDHIATFRISLEASWHAGEPVARALGDFWRTPEVYVYKDVKTDAPPIQVDVTGYAHLRYEALGTQVSQHALFGSHRGLASPEACRAEAERIKAEPGPHHELHWTARQVLGHAFLPPVETHRLATWGAATPPNPCVSDESES